MLIYDQETLARIRRLVESEPAMGRGWTVFAEKMEARDDAWVRDAKQRIAALRERWLTHGGSKLFTLGNEVRTLAKEAQNLAFYARMTDSRKAEEAVKALIFLLGEEERWVYQSGGGRQSDLWTADIGLYLAAAYDAVRNACHEEERRRIEEMLYRKAYLPLYEDWLHPAKKIHALDTMGHNWWIVCVSAAGLLLLVLEGHMPHADEALHTITESIRAWFAYPGNVLQNKQANFGADGDYVETMGYLDYALGNFLVFEAAYRKRTGDTALGELDVLNKIPDVYLETIYGKKDGQIGTFHFGDEGDRKKHAYVWLRVAELQQRRELIGLFAAVKGDPSEAPEFAFYPENLPAQAPVSAEKEGIVVLEHSGYGFVRWRSGGEQIVLAVKTGESWNHNHLDVGTFILTIGGHPFVDDSGHCAYSKPLYNAYYRQSAAHNVVLFNGHGQPPALIEEGTKFPGSIPDWLHMPGYEYLLADCTGPYSGLYRRFYRHFICVEGAMILVDDLQAEKNGTFEWLLHMPAGMKIKEGAAEPFLFLEQAEIKLRVLHPYPEQKEYRSEQGYLTSFYRESGLEDTFPEAKYAKIRSASEDGRIKFVSVFLLPNSEGKDWKVERSQNSDTGKKADVQAISIKRAEGGHIEIFVNLRADGRVMHDNSHTVFGALETDAFLAILFYDSKGSLTRVALHNGSYIKQDGRCLFSCLLKGSAVLDYRKGLQAATSLSAEAWCYFALDQAPNQEFESGLRYDADSGMWKRKMQAGHSRFSATIL
ncbi:heparinase II/III domain-containing protein [Saccharibacillus sacchari]|uniref:Heparinase II/III family protein n=1 Tax=Saccharibacillus sacchari TaxID=456493 RepID=A0ACC6PEY2_9BACL